MAPAFLTRKDYDMGRRYTYRYIPKEELQKYINANMTIAEIARETQMTAHLIEYRLKKFGLKTLKHRGSREWICPIKDLGMIDEIENTKISVGDKIGGLPVTGVYKHFVTLKKHGYTVTATYVDIWQAKLKQSKGALG
jgi:hypothetical protein